MMNWSNLNDTTEIPNLKKESDLQSVLIFKHSTRCSISSTALARLERNWEKLNPNTIKPYFLDLIKHRNLSNRIAEEFQVKHESPQVLLIKNNQCVHTASHLNISLEEIMRHAQE